MGTLLIVLLVIIAVIIVLFIKIYNKLIGQIEAVDNNKKQIDIQLDRRYKVFESLIAVVKNYMDYEKTTLKDVVALRNQAQVAKASGDEQARMAAENAISQAGAHLNVVFEQYPDLKANQNVLQLQEEIVNTENKLSFAKQAYNASIETYNRTKKSFIESLVVALFSSYLEKYYEYWSLPEDQIKAKEEYTVKM